MTDHQALLPDGTWKLDADRTTVTVSVTKLAAFTVSATLDLIDGTVQVSDGHVSDVHARVDSGSYRSPNAKRNEHVTGPDFLDAANHPEIRFSAASAEATSAGHVVTGTVSIKGKSFPLSITTHNIATVGNDGSFQASASVDRTAIGVGKMPAFIISHMLELTIDAHAHRIDTESTESEADG